MTLYRPKGSKNWHMDFTTGDGRRVRKSTRMANKPDARTVERKARMAEEQKGGAHDMLMTEATGMYWRQHASELSSHKTIQRHVHVIDEHFGRKSLSSLKNADVAGFIQKLRKTTKLSNTTINRYVQTLRAVVMMAESRWDAPSARVNWNAHYLREPDQKPRFLKEYEAVLLIEAAPEYLKRIITFALATGMRKSNILTMQYSDVDVGRMSVRIMQKSKKLGGSTHHVPLSAPAIDAVGHGTGFVFTKGGKPITSIDRDFKKTAERAGLTGLRFHDLRHTTASWMLESGVDLDLIRSVLGHSSIQTTMRYAKRDTALRGGHTATAQIADKLSAIC